MYTAKNSFNATVGVETVNGRQLVRISNKMIVLLFKKLCRYKLE
jgi:hypothetical protein